MSETERRDQETLALVVCRHPNDMRICIPSHFCSALAQLLSCLPPPAGGGRQFCSRANLIDRRERAQSEQQQPPPPHWFVLFIFPHAHTNPRLGAPPALQLRSEDARSCSLCELSLKIVLKISISITGDWPRGSTVVTRPPTRSVCLLSKFPSPEGSESENRNRQLFRSLDSPEEFTKEEQKKKQKKTTTKEKEERRCRCRCGRALSCCSL